MLTQRGEGGQTIPFRTGSAARDLLVGPLPSGSPLGRGSSGGLPGSADLRRLGRLSDDGALCGAATRGKHGAAGQGDDPAGIDLEQHEPA